MTSRTAFGNKFDIDPDPDSMRRVGGWLLVAALWLFTLGVVALYVSNA